MVWEQENEMKSKMNSGCSNLKLDMSTTPCGPDLSRKQYAIDDDGKLYEDGNYIGDVIEYNITAYNNHVVRFRWRTDNKYLDGMIQEMTILSPTFIKEK